MCSLFKFICVFICYRLSYSQTFLSWKGRRLYWKKENEKTKKTKMKEIRD